MYEYKDEIIASRVGCLGASDADLICNIATNGFIPKFAMKRLAIVKGIIQPQDNFKTDAMQLGDEIEMKIFEILHEQDSRWQSNYKLESKKHSRENVTLIAHIDFFLKDDDKKEIRIVEGKATKDNTMATKERYTNQLFVQYILGNEYAKSLGKGWKVKLSLCHYCTAYHDGSFDANNMTIKGIRFRTKPFDIDKGMDLISDYIKDMEYYGEEDEEIDANMLPADVKQQFDMIAKLIKEIDERNNAVEMFKRKLYEFFYEKGIKSVKNDVFSMTLVEPTTSVSFDHKQFLSDYERKHPRKYSELLKKYRRETQRRGYIKIKVK